VVRSGGKVDVTWRDVEGGGPDHRAEWAATDPAAALAEILSDFRAVNVHGAAQVLGRGRRLDWLRRRARLRGSGAAAKADDLACPTCSWS